MDKKPPEFDPLLKAGFDHPCKGTCSGWQQGFERGLHEALENDIEETNEFEVKLTEAVKTINEVQNKLRDMGLNSSGSFGDKVREVFNLNSRFLSQHPKEQNAYLRQNTPLFKISGGSSEI